MSHVQWATGDRIRASLHHWARPHNVGTIVAINLERDSEHIYYVRFDQKGKGIEGHYLWMDIYNIEPFYETSRSTNRKPNAEKSTANK